MSKIKHLILLVVLLIASLALYACAPQVEDTSPEAVALSEAVASPEPVTLRLAIPDGDNVLYAPYVLEFIEQAKTLSDGTITIEPTWQAGDSTDAGYEVGVIQLVKEGKFDLGLAASRSFDSESITSFEALQAPFLIDNDALAKAVATSDAASQMLENLSSSGLAGLTLWPEDLRHPFSVDPAKPLLSPDAFAGLTIRSTDTGVGEMLIKTLGGNPIFEASDYQGAESGLRQGAHLTGRPAATGNVTFFAKYQVLFANGAAFEKLSDAQRTAIKEAAAAAQKKALAERPSDVEAGTNWCADGGTVVLASDEQVAAFQKASQPVFDKLQQNSFNAESIAAISELKAKTTPSPGAQACESDLALLPTPDASAQTWSTGLPPNGVWQVTLTSDDVIKMGVSKATAPDWSGVYTFTFEDGVFNWTKEGTNGQTDSDDGNYEVVEDFVRLSSGDYWDDFQWRLDEEERLHFHLLATHNDPFTEIRAMFEAKPWQKVEEWSQGLLPNGVWQAELSVEDLVAVGGVMESSVRENAGVHTFTFQDGNFTWTLQGDSPGSCEGTYSLVGDINRLTATGGCAPEVDDIQWRLDDEGLHLHLVAIENAPFEVIRASLEARPYQKVADK
jgi:TRAP-type C4-dicarboxylate transport system substrate-binding protein